MQQFTASGRWASFAGSKDILELDSFSLVTFNAWFDPRHQVERRHALLELLEETDADFVALEEVTPEFLRGVLASEFVREQYVVSVGAIEHPAGHDVVLLSAFPPSRCWMRPLSSTLARRMWAFEYDTQRGKLAIAGVHLESGAESAATRVIQATDVIEALASSEHAVVAGDMNFDPGSAEDARFVEHGFEDAWARVHPDLPGFTRDTARNAMAARLGSAQQRRIDHVYVRSADSSPTSVDLLGTAAIEGLSNVWPSDHFGVRVSVARR